MAMNMDAILRIKAQVAGLAQIGQLQDGLKGVEQRSKAAGAAAQGLGVAMRGLSSSIAAVLGPLSAGVVVAKWFEGFNQAELAAQKVNSLGVNVKDLQVELLRVSTASGGLASQTELMAAAYDVASAGFGNAGDNAKILEASLNGAVGGLSDINTVADAATSVLNAYGLSADNAARLIDGFIQTQNDGKIVVDQYAQQIGNVAPIAAAAGISIGELNAAIATVTATGVPVESTFAGLRQAISSILKPSSEAQKLATQLGIDFNETALRSKGFAGVLEEVATKTKGSTTAMTTLFGSVEAVSTILPITNDGLVRFNSNLDNQTMKSGQAADAAEKLGSTVSRQFTMLLNGIGNVARQLDQVLGPALQGILRQAQGVLQSINESLSAGARLQQFGMGAQQRNQLYQQAQREAMDIARLRAGRGAGQFGRSGRAIDTALVQRLTNERFRDLIESYGYRTGQIKPSVSITPAAKPVLPPATIDGGGGGGGTAGGGRAGGGTKAAADAKRADDAAKKEAERVQSLIRDRLAEAELMKLKSEMQDRIVAAERDGDAMLAARLRGQEREVEIQYRYAQQLAAERDIEAQRAIIYEGNVALVANRREIGRDLSQLQLEADQRRFNALQQLAEKQYEMNTAVQNQLQLADGIADTLGQGMTSAFDGLISGAENWGESLRQIAAGALQDIANQLIRIFVIEQAISAIKTFLTPFSPSTPIGAGGGQVGRYGTLGPNYGIPQRANGGPVQMGTPYLIGERGPELFVPGRSGTVLPTTGGTTVTVNVDAKGSSVEGNNQQASQLGRVIGAAVQAELVKQKRPGGLLAT
jgi:TP901 family phage tail tape measure protein